MSRYLIVGGAGFIGSNIAENLLNEGHYVRVLDNFYSGKESNLDFTSGLGNDKYELIRGDIRDKEACLRSCEGIDYVLLQAALRSVPRSMKYPREYNDVNINGVLNVLQASSEKGVKRLVFASTSAIYGDTDQFPVREDQLPKLISPYALSKLAGEYYCRIFAEHYNVETVCLRYFNVFGKRQALDDEYAVVVPKFTHSIMNDQPPPIFGSGKQSRDFTHVDNIVLANILAATTPGVKHEVFNVGIGENNTVLTLVDLLNKILRKSVKPQFLDVRKGDVFKTHADISKIRKILKYEPRMNFQDGLQTTVAEFKGQFEKIL